MCAVGHCVKINANFNFSGTPESDSLYKVFGQIDLFPPFVNDGSLSKYQQPTPKQRILAALYDIREATIKPIKVESTTDELSLKTCR